MNQFDENGFIILSREKTIAAIAAGNVNPTVMRHLQPEDVTPALLAQLRETARSQQHYWDFDACKALGRLGVGLSDEDVAYMGGVFDTTPHYHIQRYLLKKFHAAGTTPERIRPYLEKAHLSGCKDLQYVARSYTGATEEL